MILLGSLILGSSAAFGSDSSKFEEADADTSGSLSLTEFQTTFSKGTPEEQVLKKFGKADNNHDQSVSLDEWIVYKSEVEDEGNDTAKFNAADVDSSGTLTLTEFRSTFSANTREDQVLKKFNRADTNQDDSVSLDEWVVYKQEIEDETQDRLEDTAKFNAADDDSDGFLSYGEFLTTNRGKKPEIEARRRFVGADADDDSFLSLPEWLAYKNGKGGGGSGKIRKFDLADLDGNDELTPDEFATTFPANTPMKTVLKKFNKEDDDDSGALTRDEWNPGKGKGHDDTP